VSYPSQTAYCDGRYYTYRASFPGCTLDFKGSAHDRGPLASHEFFELSTIHRRRRYSNDEWKICDKYKIHHNIRRRITNKLVKKHNKIIRKKEIGESTKGGKNSRASGICAGCERKFDVLYRKGRLYYCKDCLKNGKIIRESRKKIPDSQSKSYPRPRKVGRQSSYRSSEIKSVSKKIFIVSFVCLSIFVSVYIVFSSQETEIISLQVNKKELFSGDHIKIYVTLRRNVLFDLGFLLDSLNDLVGSVDEINLMVDGEIANKREINSRFNEEMTYSLIFLEKEPGKHVISVGVLSEDFEVLRIARFEGGNLEMVPNNPWIGENISVSLRIENIGGIRDDKVVFCYMDNKEIGKTGISLNPEQSTVISFPFSQNIIGLHDVSITWDDGELNTTVEVIAPDETLLSRPSYYYGWAERYVSTEYQIPENKDIEGLIFFLDQIEFPEYVKGEFDCSECSSLLEWLLEGAGFHTYVARKPDLSHAWIQVEIEDDIIAIESTQLTDGWGHDDSIKPWGIVSMYDGTYEELTYEYRYRYQMFLDWKEKHSSSAYKWNRDITFEKWKEKYLLSFPSFQIGIPNTAQYYYPYLGYDLPLEQIEESGGYKVRIFSTGEYDWWSVAPYANMFPFSEWS